MARKPEEIPGFDKLSPRAKLILTGNSVYDRPVDQRGTVSRDISQGGPTTRKPTAKKSVNTFKLGMTQLRDIIGSPASTNHYYVDMPLKPEVIDFIREQYTSEADQIINFVSRKIAFFCSEATLPVSSYATAEVKDNFLGVPQEFAHTRLYTDLDFTFYIDHDYNILRFFEIWMDYISSGALTKSELSITQNEYDGKNYYRRFKFPNQYKSDRVKIIKFEKDYKQALYYHFINAFPKGLTAIPVSYGPAELLKVTVTFNYDRYFVSRGSIESVATSLSLEDRLESLADEVRRSQQNQ